MGILYNSDLYGNREPTAALAGDSLTLPVSQVNSYKELTI